MRQVVHEARGDSAEHRLAFLPDGRLLQFAQLVGGGVEGIAQQGLNSSSRVMCTR